MPRVHEETFDVALPIERAWAVMADTQHLNLFFFSLDAMTVVGRDDAKTRLRGGFGMFAPEYDEYPWVFEAPHRYQSRRVFTRGLLKELRTDCVLEENGASTRVRYQASLETVPGVVGAIASRVFMSRLTAGLRATRAFLETVGKGPGAPVWPPANPLREAVLERARPLAQAIDVHDADERAALDHLVGFVADQPEPDVARMRPYELATTWRLPRQKVLAAFLRATQAGLLRLSWDLLCPSCDGPTSVASLHDLPQGGHCPACDIDFSTSFDENVEATFSPEPQVRPAQRLVFCHGSPGSTKAWLAQFVVPPGGSHALSLALGAGRYRVQAAGLDERTLLEVKDDASAAEAHVTVQPRGEHTRALPAQIAPVKPGTVTLTVENTDTVARRVQLAHRVFASYAATAADVTALGLFKELFGQDALDPGQHIAVGRRSIVFTDLVGSTAMYERIGDAAAYGLVREHFKLLFAEVERFDGRVVKTVGDCVMASFDAPADAARAARAMIVALRGLRDRRGEPSGLKLRVGVHTGSCLAVEANGQTDYFGRTVNVAARVEGLAGADELVLSWTAVDDDDVRRFLDEVKQSGDAVSQDRRAVKGVAGEVDVVRVRVSA